MNDNEAFSIQVSDTTQGRAPAFDRASTPDADDLVSADQVVDGEEESMLIMSEEEPDFDE